MSQLNRLLARPQTTSLELVELLNALRSESEPRLRHDHFMQKVPKVLGVNARKFAATYNSPSGEHRCYLLPRREACLLVMSYGYELQSKLFDLLVRTALCNGATLDGEGGAYAPPDPSP